MENKNELSVEDVKKAINALNAPIEEYERKIKLIGTPYEKDGWSIRVVGIVVTR